MGYELIWQPFKQGWAVYSTVSCGFVAEGLKTPAEVANFIVGKNDYYFASSIEGQQLMARAEFRSRDEIVSKLDQEISEAKEMCWQELEEGRWEKKCLNADEVKRNLQSVRERLLERWDRGEIRPDPKAKEKLRSDWEIEAVKVLREGRLVIETMKCEITPEGLEYKGREVQGPERW